MNIIFYCPSKNGYYDNFSSFITFPSRQKKVEIHRDIETFSHRLKKPYKNKAVVVIYAETLEDLIDVYLIKHLLRGISLILILPDNEKDTLAMGSLLRPVFTFNINSSTSDISYALQIFIRNKNPDIALNHHIFLQENLSQSFVKPLCRAA
jgi:hypothetical protein